MQKRVRAIATSGGRLRDEDSRDRAWDDDSPFGICRVESSRPDAALTSPRAWLPLLQRVVTSAVSPFFLLAAFVVLVFVLFNVRVFLLSRVITKYQRKEISGTRVGWAAAGLIAAPYLLLLVVVLLLDPGGMWIFLLLLLLTLPVMIIPVIAAIRYPQEH